ncbi:YgaP family membrane protein [Thiocystis violascens]|uniref:Inner membrane protein YgaP-like transmembrane domain-containing protein n=1 Tax=Thiocystis violascens (strain ATCC 17096 / DSM 198 / 6111) TaxID=765911 RepID=I3Y897_THIV6|nr:DUF2892 domain-containing protein [Thiocystis violascens]AFL73215.1 Protein of unknown function (DUF2892) [Thiocystis violascens DSM 198]
MTLPKNVGAMDRNIRLVAAGILILAGLMTGKIILDILGLIVLATGWLGFCPAYLPFKINTIKNSES